MAAERRVRLFRNGRNRAIRIPRDFEIEDEFPDIDSSLGQLDEVDLRPDAQGAARKTMPARTPVAAVPVWRNTSSMRLHIGESVRAIPLGYVFGYVYSAR